MDNLHSSAQPEIYELDNAALCEAISAFGDIPPQPPEPIPLGDDPVYPQPTPRETEDISDQEPDAPEPKDSTTNEPANPERGAAARRRKRKKPSLFVLALAAAAVVLLAIAVTTTVIHNRQQSANVTEIGAETPEQSETPTTMYITKLTKPNAPESADTASTNENVVEKTPLYWGVDVSEHQLSIDWDAVALTGADFAMVRAAYRGYTQGDIYVDEYFEENITGALDAGLDVGVYFFSQATTAEEAVKEAKYVLWLVKKYDITYPIAYDWEYMSGESSRTADITAETVTDCALAFCETIAYAGYTPMVYFNQVASEMHFDLERLRVFDFWLADYSDEPAFPYDYQMWQYTASGSVDGITGDVDINYCFSDYTPTPMGDE